MSNSRNRSFEAIRQADLVRLSELARECIADMLARKPTGRYYSLDKLLMACLCQGAAQHYVHRDRGVQDFDVVYFFKTNTAWQFPPRWRGTCDFGVSRFGTNPDDGPTFKGRRIDVLGRDIAVSKGMSAEDAIVAYLREGRTRSAKEWSKRPLVAFEPHDMLGQVVWDG